jgi:hypothetical protein
MARNMSMVTTPLGSDRPRDAFTRSLPKTT